MKKLVIFASALAILATPALAGTTAKHHHKAHAKVSQADAPGWGTGNVLPYQFDTQGKAHRILTPQGGGAPSR